MFRNGADFDEWSYLHHNPDVAEMVRSGRVTSGAAHYAETGETEYRKGKRTPPPSVREQSYLLRNPDVATAVRAGTTFKSGHDHWLRHGRKEEAEGLRKPYLSGAPRHVDDVDLSTWADGYVIIPSMFTAGECDAIVEMTDRLWRERASINRPIAVDIFLNASSERSTLLKDAPEEATDHPLKINNLYFYEPQARAMVLSDRLCRIIRHLIDGDPVALTSLNFRKGSEQGFHLDTFYMPPAIPYRMVAAWIALEDVTAENGPLKYVPGSNRIPPYYFEGHRLRVNNTEKEYNAFSDYFMPKIRERQLRTAQFTAKKGDVLIWHSLLYHGGDPIADKASTRHSMVAHYFAAADYPGGCTTGATGIIEHSHGCFYENRPSAIAVAPDGEGMSFPE